MSSPVAKLPLTASNERRCSPSVAVLSENDAVFARLRGEILAVDVTFQAIPSGLQILRNRRSEWEGSVISRPCEFAVVPNTSRFVPGENGDNGRKRRQLASRFVLGENGDNRRERRQWERTATMGTSLGYRRMPTLLTAFTKWEDFPDWINFFD